jgi:hypothetical protein
MVDCASGAPADPLLVAKMFDGKPEPLEADLLGFFESLADGVESKPCAGLDASAMADGLVAMLDRSTLPAGDLSLWRLRFRTARLYYSVGRADDALREARKAYDGGTSDPPVALFMAGILISKGEKQAAGELVERAASRISSSDAQGQQLVRTYRETLSGAAN